MMEQNYFKIPNSLNQEMLLKDDKAFLFSLSLLELSNKKR